MITDPIARQTGKDIAERIRQELVCCDIYSRVNDNVPEDVRGARYRAALDEIRGHARCYWGEASARIAEGICPQRSTVPDVCQCDCSGCLTDCWNHVEPEDDPEPKCNCGHPERQHIAPDRVFGPQCKVCPEDGERTWKHPFTAEEKP